MGKKVRKKIRISPVKERNKIRDSILQVFRARLQSPGKGGALLVGKSADNSPLATDPKKIKQTRLSSSSSDIVSDSSDSLMAKKKKVLCKRKTTKESSQKMSDDRIKKHIKKTEMLCSMPSAGNSSEQKISLITESRVTKCLGLFNRGRKSKRIERVPISMSESVHIQTNKNLKRVLNITNASDTDSSKEEEEDADVSYSNVPCKKSSPLTFVKSNSRKCYSKENLQQNKTSGKKSSVKIEYEAQSSSATSCVTVSDDISPCSEMKENLPKQPPIKEIAREMISKLQPKQRLFNRNIRQERFNELHRLMRQSVLFPSCDNSTEKTKPATMISAKRSLLDPTVLHAEGLKSNVKTDTSNGTENDEQSWNLPEFYDAKSLLMQNDMQMKFDPNAQNFGKFSENSDDVAFKSSFKNCQNKSLVSHAPLPPDGDKHLVGCDSVAFNQDRMKLIPRKKFVHQTENRSSSIVLQDRPQFRETPKSVPSLRGDWMEPMGSCIKRKQIYQSEESLDLLDFLDQNSTTDSTWDSQSNIQTWNKSVFKDENHSEHSPLWLQMANLPPSPVKPCLDTSPSPPKIFYPRKSY